MGNYPQKDLNLLLSRLDLAAPGLSAAARHLEKGDQDSALKEVVRHFRTRTAPRYLFDEGDIVREPDPAVLADAQKVLDHEIFGYHLGKRIDFSANRTAEICYDFEWTWSLNRHGYLHPLARAYGMTGDEKYAREFVSIIKEFTAQMPGAPRLDKTERELGRENPAWRTIETGIRLYTSWFPCMVYFCASPSWDEAGWLCFLNAVHDHAEFLCTHYSNHLHSGNWLTMEAAALFQAGVLFPEFKRGAHWQALGCRRVTHETRYQFDHMGVHSERTPIYHLTVAGAFLQAYRMMLLNGIPAPPYMLPILEKSAGYLMKLVKPDLSTPMVGDADHNSLLDRRSDPSAYEGMNLTFDPQDENEIRAFFRVMAQLTGREDFLWLATGRQEGAPPKDKLCAMPDQGFYTYRTGWGPKDSYFMLTGIGIERGERTGHAHLDAGHLELMVEGEDILIDTGRYIYGNNRFSDWREYFQSPAAHNTVQVDSHTAGSVPGAPDWVRRSDRTWCHLFEDRGGCVVADISHNGFAFMEQPVFHRRQVVFVKPGVWLVDDILTGYGSHTYRLSFNFAPGELVQNTTIKNFGSYTYRRKGITMQVVPLLSYGSNGVFSKVYHGSADPKGGWVSYGYGRKEPVPQLLYYKHGEAPMRFVTALYRDDGATTVTKAHTGGAAQVELIVNQNGDMMRISLGDGQIHFGK